MMNLSHKVSKKKKKVKPEKLIIQMQSWFYPKDFMVYLKGAYIFIFAFSTDVFSSLMAGMSLKMYLQRRIFVFVYITLQN